MTKNIDFEFLILWKKNNKKKNSDHGMSHNKKSNKFFPINAVNKQ